jgi:molybdenum cofactor biosynthesis enzyme MoaA
MTEAAGPLPDRLADRPGRPADRFGRPISYLRVSVTDRCDLRCGYCIPPGHIDFCERPDVLDAAEFARLVGLFVTLGVSRVRLTGGEPLTRADLPEVAARIGAIAAIRDVSLSTNSASCRSPAASWQGADPAEGATAGRWQCIARVVAFRQRGVSSGQ